MGDGQVEVLRGADFAHRPGLILHHGCGETRVSTSDWPRAEWGVAEYADERRVADRESVEGVGRAGEGGILQIEPIWARWGLVTGPVILCIVVRGGQSGMGRFCKSNPFGRVGAGDSSGNFVHICAPSRRSDAGFAKQSHFVGAASERSDIAS